MIQVNVCKKPERWDIINHTNIHKIGVPEKKKKRRRVNNYLKNDAQKHKKYDGKCESIHPQFQVE